MQCIQTFKKKPVEEDGQRKIETIDAKSEIVTNDIQID